MGIFECRLEEAAFIDPVRIEGTRRHRVKLLLKVSFKNAKGTTARVRGVTMKIPPGKGFLRSDEYDSESALVEMLVAWDKSVIIATDYIMETEDLDGDQRDQLRRGPAIGILCAAEAVIILDYIEQYEASTSSRFSVASSKGTLPSLLQEIP